MKSVIKKSAGLASLCFLLTSSAFAADEGGAFDFGKLTASESAQFVEVNIRSNLIKMVSDLARKSEPEVADAIGGLKQIRVNVLGLDDTNREEVQKQIKAVRSSLSKDGWERIVTARKENQDVGVFLKMRSSEAVEGIVVTVLNGESEAVLVNVVGDIRPEKLAIVGERFNIEPLKEMVPQAEKHASKVE
ncbi:MAG: DUF4252 domain-containing protein [Verrucomicrobiota bacterium]|nr:DUF4252 domain-containing protein [Verrucomicrobiota bacterium]